ncbi:hypothetical protein Aab01nite_78090 [Paractinoplanes abujensis]|nr:hypothetical protein Aab01nite_78090 [Actinoplanes abujensis]
MRDAGRRVAGLAALVVGLTALAIGVATLHEPGRVPTSAGALPGVSPSSAVPGAVPSSAVPGVSPSSAVPGVSFSSAATRAAPPKPAGPVPEMPGRVVIPGLKVDAPVDPAGVERGGELRIPADPARLGWWIGSARPGVSRGTVLIAGHVDTAEDGRGALYSLETLPMGARIEVRAGRTTYEYRAVARRSFVKRQLPADVFSTATSPRLVLITCGGDFRDGSYSHNVLVYAEPVSRR